MSEPARAGPALCLSQPRPPCRAQPSVPEEGRGGAGFCPELRPGGRHGADSICPSVVCSHATTPGSKSTALCLTGIVTPSRFFRVSGVLSVPFCVQSFSPAPGPPVYTRACKFSKHVARERSCTWELALPVSKANKPVHSLSVVIMASL